MEGTHTALNLYMPIEERCTVSSSLFGGMTSHFKDPLKTHSSGLTSSSKEEGLTHSIKQGHSHKMNYRETLQGLDKFSEVHWLSELLPLCTECQAFMNMGNQQGTKIKTDILTEDELFTSEICYKRRKGTEGRVHNNNFQHRFKMASGNPLKAKKVSKIRTMNYPTFEKAEDTSSIWSPLTKRKRSIGTERYFGPASTLNETYSGQQNVKSIWDVNPDMQSLLHFPKSPLSTKKPVNEEKADSETDLSEYDNETSTDPTSTTKSSVSTETSQKYDETYFHLLDKIGKQAASLRIMGKIQEVEGIIRRVSITSSDLIKEGDQSEIVEVQFSKTLPENGTKSADLNNNSPLLLDELRALGEALSQSLQQALKMEEGNPSWESTNVHKCQTTRAVKRPQYLPINPCYNEINRLSTTDRETTGFSSQPFVLDTSARASSNFEGQSPIMSPLLTSILSNPVPQIETKWTEGSWGSGTRDLGKSDTNEDCVDVHKQEDLLYSDEALRRQEEVWQQELEESLSFSSSLSHPSRPKHVDFLHITALDEDIITPAPTPPLSRDLWSEASSPGDGEERTPGRLQAVWPPLKEEKVGLKYTEAEHQAALLQLKRECKEDLEKLQEDYDQELTRLKAESDDSVARLEFTIIELQTRLSQSESRHRGEVRNIAVSTGDDILHKTFRTVCLQTDRETFVTTPDNDDGRISQQKVEPKKLDMESISLNLSGQKDDTESLEISSQSTQSTNTKSHLHTPLLTGQTQNIHVPPQLPMPPPPPPLPSSGPGVGPPPPPPPPLFGGGVISVDRAPRKPAKEPSRPMKPLYWTRIQVQENNKETLWNKLEEPSIINSSDFEDLFAKTTTQTKRKPLSETFEKKVKTRKIVKLLDGKRSQAVGILISSLHLEMKDIQNAVLTVDNSLVDMDTIEALYENRAQPDELGRIKKHYETSNEEEIKLLDKPEQFLYELSQIQDFASRAHCIIFQSAFLDGIASIQRKLQAVLSVCEVLLDSANVKEIIGLVLALGNHMNGGSRTRGQADGFGLEILPKLKDVKSRDNRISLGDYVVSYFLRNVDKNAGTDKSMFPLPEPQDVFLAAQVKFEDLQRDLRQLARDLTQCEKDVQKVCSNSPEEHLQPFKDKMEAFVLSARKEHGEASYQLMKVEKSFQDLVVYFGLRPKTGEKEVSTSYFFMLWFEFCADFKVRWKRENKNISKERLKEAQLSVKRITGEKKVETRKINPNSLKERLRQKEANMSSI